MTTADRAKQALGDLLFFSARVTFHAYASFRKRVPEYRNPRLRRDHWLPEDEADAVKGRH